MNENVLALIKLYDDYLNFLFHANNEAILIAFAHGWKCTKETYEQGKEYRKKIEDLKEKVKKQEQDDYEYYIQNIDRIIP
jgi:ADP-dependent phosphofructokinase/glucokinase